jgi:hypothetical protein
MAFNETTKISELTVAEFRMLVKAIIEDVVQEAVFTLEQQLPDPDEGKALRPEFASQLQKSINNQAELMSFEAVAKALQTDE